MKFNEVMTASLLSMIPVIVLFLAFQRFIVQGLSTSGLKA
jgi:ABC-type maltose transport system permease subunit